VDNRYRVVRDKLNFATDGCKADGVDYCIVTRVILIDVHVKSIADYFLEDERARYFARNMLYLRVAALVINFASKSIALMICLFIFIHFLG